MKNSGGGGGVGSLVFSSGAVKEDSDSTDDETSSISPDWSSGLLRAVPEVCRNGKSREGKYEVLDALVGDNGDNGGDKDIVGIAKKSSVKERVGCAMGC